MYERLTTAAAEPAWRTTLVSASCTTRYAATSTGWGSRRRTPCTSITTSSPVAVARSISWSTSSSVGVGARGATSPRAQDVEDRAQLFERVLARVLDRAQRGTGLLRQLVAEVERDAGLHVDERDVVRDDIVEVTRDPEPLVARAAGVALRAPSAPARRVRSRRMCTISVPVARTINHAASPSAPGQPGAGSLPNQVSAHSKAKYPMTIEIHATARWPAFTTVTNATMSEKKIGPRPYPISEYASVAAKLTP